MLSTEDITSNARDRTALSYLQVGLEEAVQSGRPAAVRWIPTSHTDRQLVELATGLVARRGVNALVLGGGPVTFMPLR
ncbi:MAG TPA: hypothetical protein VGO39_07885 [Gaiellaceae bacterium]|jgi:hypothetical protein|nr:hypothetical protein [Gaiellaceae bacterium]